ncbi:N-acetylmuramic acid 6-phosphate etherase [Fervidobacterium changbaicum]|uniref:N-acetylmuramic acid 6-phosphate etherase n=1 Tax=Fervidobacterium changbaicum TaxID=310769 RepID=A0ABX5QQW5_9BACT|nr:N-acetylmuramic acid 6-phosphate etherase [Fervidobacterium changbaicum]QAV32753.1 N-acetylmuramic acid 6-phosphate etherase [Fervidobacterium changbaicum]SDG96849.1 N-acetylmuramic acid 6-phosphate etherase [Fervidobacterium changbaicum]
MINFSKKSSFEELETEKPNPLTENIDQLDTLSILRIINDEDRKVALAVSEVLDKIAKVVDFCVEAIKDKGRVIYAGAGTSGRIGYLDAVEVVPTFGMPPDVFVPLIAGGEEALKRSVEAVEDNFELGREDARKVTISSRDVVIGITASGRTPYVGGVLDVAREHGARTVLICNVSKPALAEYADIVISIKTGPEVIAGSTRMKAGTSQKMVLNMISTTTMVKLGKVYKNQMVDVLVLNEKLKERAIRIIMKVTGVDYRTASEHLKIADNNTKVAILMILTGKSKKECEVLLENYGSITHVMRHISTSQVEEAQNIKKEERS